MAFQSAVNYQYTTGFIGDVLRDGPLRAKQFRLDGQTTNPNAIGFAYTYAADQQLNQYGEPDIMTVTVGGSGPFAGILFDRLAYTAFGTPNGGPLAASIVLPPYTSVSLMDMGFVIVNFTTAVTYGDKIYFAPTNAGGDIVGGLYNAQNGGSTRIQINGIVATTTQAAGPAMIQLTN